ncbi:MAG: CRISPR-associated endonuclease Cas2 [Leptospiraceae bacterium]|nr:CRISPR-associated endonuclease Cas2 [Leptospiraceae bacterium]MDW7976737.1 CRISPR-associated endonuclease Cas2 [Leptospiraceae bacterium]
MNIETEVIIGYDVQDNKRKNKLIKTLKKEGLIRISKSQFFGFFTSLRETCHSARVPSNLKEDKEFLVDVPFSKMIRDHHFGHTNLELLKKFLIL